MRGLPFLLHPHLHAARILHAHAQERSRAAVLACFHRGQSMRNSLNHLCASARMQQLQALQLRQLAPLNGR